MYSLRCTGVPLVLLLIAAAAFAAGTAPVVPADRAAAVPEGQTDAVTIPQLINYQGKLTDADGNPLNITTDMTFRIYDGLTQVWTETQTGVQVVEGIFNVLLGSVSAISSLPEAGNCSLEVTIGAEPIVPRIPLVTVPYAYHADNTGKLQGRLVSDAAPGTNQVLAWTGSAWAPANDQTGSNYWANSGAGYIYPNTPNANTNVRIYGIGYTYNLYGATSSTYQYGVYGSNAGGFSSSFGVYGYNTASSAYAVYGYNASTATYTAAVAGLTMANYGYGVWGYSNASYGYGAYGYSGYYGSGVYGYNVYYGYGVYGYNYMYGTGVLAYGGYYGVYGYSISGTGYGVYGYNTNSYGYGVAGYNSSTGCFGILGPAYYMLSRYIGVYGYNAQSYGAGLYGYSSGSYSYGVYGYNTSSYGYGVYGYGYFGGVYGYSTGGWGVYGYNASGGAAVAGYSGNAGGYFVNTSGIVANIAYSSYGILSNGTKSCVIATSQGDRAMYCPEAPEVLFEDAGSAQLANGYCRVDLDPLMLEGCAIDDAHPLRVYVQLTSGDPVPTVVAKGRTWFEVRVADRSSNATFDWRILASRKGFEDKRLERVELASVEAPAPTGAPPPAPVAPPAPSQQ